MAGGFWVIALQNSEVLVHFFASFFLPSSVIPRDLWGKEPKSFSRWEFMKLNFALLVPLESRAKGRHIQTALQSLFLLDLSRTAPG